jgi:hypothetical protein
LQPNPNGPDLLSASIGFLAEQLALIPRAAPPLVLVMESMNGSSIEGKEPHLERQTNGDLRPVAVCRALVKQTFAKVALAYKQPFVSPNSSMIALAKSLQKEREGERRAFPT